MSNQFSFIDIILRKNVSRDRKESGGSQEAAAGGCGTAAESWKSGGVLWGSLQSSAAVRYVLLLLFSVILMFFIYIMIFYFIVIKLL